MTVGFFFRYLVASSRNTFATVVFVGVPEVFFCWRLFSLCVIHHCLCDLLLYTFICALFRLLSHSSFPVSSFSPSTRQWYQRFVWRHRFPLRNISRRIPIRWTPNGLTPYLTPDQLRSYPTGTESSALLCLVVGGNVGTTGIVSVAWRNLFHTPILTCRIYTPMKKKFTLVNLAT